MTVSKAVVFGCLILFAAASPLFAETVQSVDAQDGGLLLQDGRKVYLAGIQLDEQGVSIVRVLTEKQNIRIKELLGLTPPDGKTLIWAYLDTRSLKFPPGARESVVEREVMLNEFLIRIGAAKVSEGQEFDRKKNFLKFQDEAKKRGEGVWSYEKS